MNSQSRAFLLCSWNTRDRTLPDPEWPLSKVPFRLLRIALYRTSVNSYRKTQPALMQPFCVDPFPAIFVCRKSSRPTQSLPHPKLFPVKQSLERKPFVSRNGWAASRLGQGSRTRASHAGLTECSDQYPNKRSAFTLIYSGKDFRLDLGKDVFTNESSKEFMIIQAWVGGEQLEICGLFENGPHTDASCYSL